MRKWLKMVLVTFLLVRCAAMTDAQWAQWGGPNRDFRIDGVQLASTWPDDGPNTLWRRDLGEGNSAILVDEGRLYTMYRRSDKDVVVALDAEGGEIVWEYTYSAPEWSDFNRQYGPGPHSTPLIVGDYIYTIGFRSDLQCLNKNTGEKVWSRNLWDDFGAKPPDRGYASSPIAYKNTLIVPAGGKGSGVVAFDLHDGHVVWQNQDFNNAFSSPIVINVDGRDQVVVFVQDLVAGLDPNTGERLWKHGHHTKYDIHASTPVWGPDNLLFISSAYDAGSRGLRLSQQNGKTTVKELWYNRKMKVQHGTAVRLGDTIYGSSGDFGPAFLTGIDAESGEIRIKQRGFAKANVLAVGDKLIVLDEAGKLGLVEPEADELTVLAQADILNSRAWTVPTLVGTTLYLRDLKEIVALDLSP